MATDIEIEADAALESPACDRQTRVREHFEQCWPHYRRIWGTHRHGGMHIGLQGDGRGHDVAVLHTNRVLAGAADVHATDRVFDAGCGIGGSALWLAEHRGVQVVGVTLVPSQAVLARRTAVERGLSHLASFEVADYMTTGHPDESFDVVWGLESICYAADKAAFLREAFRLLRPDGRLVVADAFLRRPTRNLAETRLIQAWCDGWAIPNVGTVDAFMDDAREARFYRVTVADVTEATIGSSRRMYAGACWPTFRRGCSISAGSDGQRPRRCSPTADPAQQVGNVRRRDRRQTEG